MATISLPAAPALGSTVEVDGLTVAYGATAQMWRVWDVLADGARVGRLFEVADGSFQVVPEGAPRVRWSDRWNRRTLRGALRLLRRSR
ncbi:hypothetical protein [Prauserella muralis]|uniref:Uncharacterized protein n=1 Tax=Prauserella muralis TaxID=588067 RepID=A0A2V4ANY8_9PSEU|nr:hypothetical protein [Prauserella muralis]PXY20846.1 hypothetical protein BAY60_25415 [Prauserella muralis]TWE29883.1 hypothetical protein FHX69_2575 [Prauserella muralis]